MPRRTVATFIDDWTRKALPASSRKPTTQANYATIARTHIAPAPFAALTLDRLRPSDVEALLVTKREAGLSSSTVRTIYTVARAVLEIAVRDGIVRRNVAAAVKRPSVKRTDASYLTAEEVGKLLEASRDGRLYPLVARCSALVYVAVRRSACTGGTSTWRPVFCGCAGPSPASVASWCSPSRRLERSRRFVSLPAPVVDELRRYPTALAAERLAAAVWQPWPDHGDLGFLPIRHADRPAERTPGRLCTRRAGRAGPRDASHTQAQRGIGADRLRCASEGRAGDARALFVRHHS